MSKDHDRAERVAAQLMQKFNNDKDKLFYLKVGYGLSEDKVWNLYEQSQKGRTPAKLFNFLCRKEMREL